MRLSTPIHRLKREAKERAKSASLPLHAALDLVAGEQGYDRWSLLASHYEKSSPAAGLVAQLRPGELVLIAARPGRGKTLLALECAIEAARSGEASLVFSLDYTGEQVLQRLRQLGASPQTIAGIAVDCTETISAGSIAAKLAEVAAPALVVVDYLQLLDQRRSEPPLHQQIVSLRAAAARSATRMLFVAQIDRSFEGSGRPVPELSDIRLPNPLDLSLFDSAWLLGDSKMAVRTIRSA